MFDLTVRFLISGVFAWAMLSKLVRPDDFSRFKESLEGIGFEDRRLRSIVGGGVICAETFVVGGTLVGRVANVALGVAAVLLAIFAGVIMRLAHLGIEQCNCFGAKRLGHPIVHILINLSLVLLAGCVAFGTSSAPLLSEPLRAATACCLGLAVASLIVNIETLMDQMSSRVGTTGSF